MKNNTKNKEIEKFRYEMFLRNKRPSIFRLAAMELIREGRDLSSKSEYIENWNLLIDRANRIVKVLSYAKKGKDKCNPIKTLYQEVLNLSENLDE